MGRHYPPVTFSVEEPFRKQVMEECVVQVGSDHFVVKRRDREHVSSMRRVIRHVSGLHLTFIRQHSYAGKRRAGKFHVPPAVVASLQQFKRLRSLEMQGVQTTLVSTLTLAPGSLPFLISLELSDHEDWSPHALDAPLRRLCDSQLSHRTLTTAQLHLIKVRADNAMLCVRSLTYIGEAALSPSATGCLVVQLLPISIAPQCSLRSDDARPGDIYNTSSAVLVHHL